MEPIGKLQTAIVALRDQFAGMQTEMQDTKGMVRSLYTSIEKIEVGMGGAVASLAIMEEAVGELGTSIATLARTQAQQSQVLKAHDEAIEELRKKAG